MGNHLKMLPPELGLLRRLRILAADSNELVILPGGWVRCGRACAVLRLYGSEASRPAFLFFPVGVGGLHGREHGGAASPAAPASCVYCKKTATPCLVGKSAHLLTLSAALCWCCPAGELRHCSALEELTLENNRLTSILLNFRTFPHLQVHRGCWGAVWGLPAKLAQCRIACFSLANCLGWLHFLEAVLGRWLAAKD